MAGSPSLRTVREFLVARDGTAPLTLSTNHRGRTCNSLEINQSGKMTRKSYVNGRQESDRLTVIIPPVMSPQIRAANHISDVAR